MREKTSVNRVWVYILSALVLASALAVVYAKHQSRILFVELQDLKKVQDRLDTDWGRLQLEQSAWATHGRVERIARTKLGMHIPKPDNVIIIRP
jgi:cell division protein FtsL